MFNIRKSLVGLCCFLPMLAHAGDVRFKGFASVVAGQADEASAENFGYTDSLSVKEDTLFALQMDSKINDKVKATMQFMSRGRDDFEVGMEWGYLTLELSPTWDISVGRIRLPFYRYSDYLDVRYAYNWVTPPDTVYGFDLPGYEGASILNKSVFGSWDSTFQIILGKVDNTLVNNQFNLTIEDLAGFNWTLAHDWFSARAAIFTGSSTITTPEIDSLVGALRGGYAQGIADAQVRAAVEFATLSIADEVEMFDDTTTFYSAGFSIDPGTVFFEAEYIYYEVENAILPETDAWYATAGTRFNDVTLYVTYSQEEDSPDYSILGALQPANTDLAPAFTPVANIVEGAISSLANDTEHWNVGLRWDFLPSTAFKVVYEHSDYKLQDNKVGLIRAGIDVVF